MAYEVISVNEILLGSYKYRVRSPIVGSFIDPFPNQLSIGGDDYGNQLGTSKWVIDNLTGGIGTEKFISPNMCWWTNCIIEYLGHILPPRLATGVTVPDNSGYISNYTHLPNLGFETGAITGWTHSGGGSSAVSNVNPKTGIYHLRQTGLADAQTATATYTLTWDSSFQSKSFTFTAQAKPAYTGGGGIPATDTRCRVSISDGVGTTPGAWRSASAYGTVTVTRVLDASATKLELIIETTYTAGELGTGATGDFDDLTLTHPTIDGEIHFANFNGSLYMSKGGEISKLNAGRTAFTTLKADFDGTIRAIIPSLNSRLYIYLGDEVNYWYMSTAEAFTKSNSANAYWGIQYDAKLFKMNTSGTVAYSTDPDGSAPTWTSGSSITDIALQIQGFVVGRDASGNTTLYVPTKSKLKVYDSATPQWLDTEVVLPDHPNGGKGAAYFNSKTYLPYGLAVKEYYPENGSVIDVGLTELDGLPIEYNGEIVKLQGESGVKLMFALVDASQTSGNSKSGLYAFNGSRWFCWWVDTSNNGAMYDCIVSSASSGYAVYWDCGGTVYYIDIPRGIQNPNKITQSYATAGIFISPWFDSGDQGAAKLAKELNDFAKGITTTETVALKYRIDHTNTDLDTGWTSFASPDDILNTTGESGYHEILFASGAGIAFKSIQLRLDFVTAGSTAKADIQNLKLLYRMRTGALKIRRWIVEVLLDDYANGPTGNEKAKAKIANLESVITSSVDVVFSYRPNANSDEHHYVSVECERFEEIAGTDYNGGFYRLILTEV